jgi:hypothetical protein
MKDTDFKAQLERSLRKDFLFTTVITWTLVVASIVVAILAYKKVPIMSGMLIGAIPWNVQNWYEGRPSKYLRSFR